MKKMLIILKEDPNETVKTIIQELKKHSRITIHDLSKNKDYALIMEEIVKNDAVITW